LAFKFDAGGEGSFLSLATVIVHGWCPAVRY
jgi:hypothetical protein